MADLPYRDNTRPVIAMISPPEHIALLSLPMLSGRLQKSLGG
ncbi:hypothetical protein ABT126_42650 [Streptomyces sp. NPDC002012]